MLAATALATCSLQGSADLPSSALEPIVSLSIRPATPRDLSAIVALLIQDAHERRSGDPQLWRLAPDAPARVERAVGATLNRADMPAREQWLLAEHSRQIVGLVHAMIVPVPPIYAPPGAPGLFLDDCFTSADAPPGTAEALLVASEAVLRTEGAADLIVSCPAAGRLRPLYERHGYEPVTQHGKASV